MSGRGIPGTPARIAYDLDGSTPPVEGDTLRTAAGTCYLIDEVRPSPTRDRVYLRCTRLDRDAVAEGDPGVHPLYWHFGIKRR